MQKSSAATLCLALLCVASTRLVAMRVDTEPLRRIGSETAVAVTVQVAPEDRARVGDQAWLRLTFEDSRGHQERFEQAVTSAAEGTFRLVVELTPARYDLRVDVESAGGRSTGFWQGAVDVPALDGSDTTVAGGATPRPAPVATPAPRPTAPPAPAVEPVAAEPRPAPSPRPAPVTAARPPRPGPAPAPRLQTATHQLTVVVTDRSRPVADLRPSALSLRIDGADVAIDRLAGAPEAPLSVLLAVDLNATADGSPDIAQLLTRLALRIQASGGQLALLTASATPTVTLDWGATPQELTAALATATDHADADLAALVGASLDHLRGRQGRRFLLLVCDGGNSGDRAHWHAARDAVEAAGMPLLVLGLRGERLGQRLRSTLDRLADVSGGKSYFVRDAGVVEMAVSHFAELMAGSYALDFEPPPGKPGLAEIRLEARSSAYEVRCTRRMNLAD